MSDMPGETSAGVRLRRPAPAIGVLVAMALLCGGPARVGAQRAPTVAAAASLNPALADVAEQFARDRGMRVQLVFGASGTLTRQIQDGAPFEMFLAADEEFPNRLTAAGLTKGPGIVYAIGRLVIFAPTGSPLSTDARLDGLARLVKTGGVTRFAIANPDVAPCGRAAEALLRARGCGMRCAPGSCSATASRRPHSCDDGERGRRSPWRIH
jgi:molybdate transport system substrate-binding protein